MVISNIIFDFFSLSYFESKKKLLDSIQKGHLVFIIYSQ